MSGAFSSSWIDCFSIACASVRYLTICSSMPFSTSGLLVRLSRQLPGPRWPKTLDTRVGQLSDSAAGFPHERGGHTCGVPTAALVALFVASAGVIWVAGVGLSKATDALDGRLGLGSALGGLVLLAFATNLPEIAITVTAAARGNLGLAVGNLVGGIAIQTLVLALLDARVRKRPLTYQVASLTLVLEASIVLGTLGAAVLAMQLPSSVSIGPMSPGSIAIIVLWLGGLAVVNAARRGLP